MQDVLNVGLLLLWACCWIVGGWWLARAAFRLSAAEEGAVGVILGLAAEVSLVNFVARVVPLVAAAWISAVAVLLAGFVLVWRKLGFKALRIRPSVRLVFVFVALFYIFFLIARGLAIFDDYAHLPTISVMAAGSIPPRFVLDPDIPYSYHYFLLLFGAQIMRLAGAMPWTAWDLARSFTIAPAVILGGLWAYRVTRSKVAGYLGSAGVLFISGTRWLMLLIPGSILGPLSAHVTLLGSGADAGPNLAAALANPYPVDGQGSYPLAFAFENGLFPSGAQAVFLPIGLMVVALLFSLLLTGTRWRSRWGILPSVILLSSIGLLTEIEVVLMAAAVALLTVAFSIRRSGVRLPRGLGAWLIVWLASGLAIAVQGGVLSYTLYSAFLKLTGQPALVFHHVIGLVLAAPTIVSGHLGVLSLTDPRSLIVALFEIGPVLLVLPLVAVWGLKAARAGRWFEATLMLAGVLGLGMVFVHYSGAVRNSSRLYFFITVCTMMLVPLGWLWLQRRRRWVREVAITLTGIVFFGGIVGLGIDGVNIKNNIFSFFITPEDARMTEQYWNTLEPGALVFDPIAERATTIFGRYTRSHVTWYELRPDYAELRDNPEVFALNEAGFSYVYLSDRNWQALTPAQQQDLSQGCVERVGEMRDPESGEVLRMLLDIRACH